MTGVAYFYLDRFAEAESAFRSIDSLGWRGGDIAWIMATRLYQGRNKEALEYCQRREKTEDDAVKRLAYEQELTLFSFQEDFLRAKEVWQQYKKYLRKDYDLLSRSDVPTAADLLTFNIPEEYLAGDVAKAMSDCALVEDEIRAKDLGGGFAFALLDTRADLLFQSGEYREAAEKYELLSKEELRIFFFYRLADCFYKTGEYRKAEKALNSIVKNDRRELFERTVAFSYHYPRKFYLLGKVHEALGEKKEAVKAYQELLRIWKEADRDLPELIEAKAKLTKLTKE
jgi:tetratricopeptide (TPR) repeat protein